jgi:hypothetical protein
MRQLKQWYRTLDQLLAHKSDIEHALYLTLRDLFSLQVDMVFYDLTSTYFEGRGPPEKGANGHSRDGKPRNPQVLVGLVRPTSTTIGLKPRRLIPCPASMLMMQTHFGTIRSGLCSVTAPSAHSRMPA